MSKFIKINRIASELRSKYAGVHKNRLASNWLLIMVGRFVYIYQQACRQL